MGTKFAAIETQEMAIGRELSRMKEQSLQSQAGQMPEGMLKAPDEPEQPAGT